MVRYVGRMERSRFGCRLGVAGTWLCDPSRRGAVRRDGTVDCRLRRGGGFGDGRRRQYREHFDEGDRLRQSRGRVRSTVRVATAARGVLARHRKTVQAQHSPRTLPPGAPGQALHVDVGRHSSEWPLVGFIVMVDDFRPDNGATRFVPSSHRCPRAPRDSMTDVVAEHDRQVLACGSAGSLLVFDGSTWHGHTANVSGEPRRSLQGAFIPRGGHAATDFAARMQPETRERLGPLAQYVLALRRLRVARA